jgi:hypothetical protein
LELFPDAEGEELKAPVAVTVPSSSQGVEVDVASVCNESSDDAVAVALSFFLPDGDAEDPFAVDVLDALLLSLTPGSEVISVN